jgi:hypothetical protein
LDDVHATRERGVDEVGQIAAVGARVGAEVELRGREPPPDLRSIESWHGQDVNRGNDSCATVRVVRTGARRTPG